MFIMNVSECDTPSVPQHYLFCGLFVQLPAVMFSICATNRQGISSALLMTNKKQWDKEISATSSFMNFATVEAERVHTVTPHIFVLSKHFELQWAFTSELD